MGSRDTGDLYTGMTSSSADRIAVERDKRQDEKVKVIKELLPAAEIIKKELERDKLMLLEVLADILNPDSPDEKIGQRLIGVRMHRKWIQDFEMRVMHKLRAPQKPKKKEGADEPK